MPALLRGPPKAGGPASRDTQSQPSPGSQTDQSPCHDSSSAACWAVPCPIHARPGNLWPQESPQTPASASRAFSQVQGPQFGLWGGAGGALSLLTFSLLSAQPHLLGDCLSGSPSPWFSSF